MNNYRKIKVLFQKNKSKIIRYACLGLFCYIVLNIFFFHNYSIRVFFKSKSDYEKLIVSHEQIKETNLKLENEIEKLKNDPFYIESIARRDYKMVKKGEIVYNFKRK